MENYIGKICPFCKTEIKEGDAVKVCPACGIPHHEGCWNENKGCTTFGCSQQHYEPKGTNPTAVCVNCGTALGDAQMFCPKCGTPKNAPPRRSFCSKCGAELQVGQEFCSKCGQKVGLVLDQGVNAAINQFNAGINQTQTKKKKKKTPLIIVLIIVAIIVALTAFGGGGSGGGKNFNKMYASIAGEYWCTISSDGTWMKLDTNPYDLDDSFNSTAWYKIKSVLVDLGFPSSVAEEMNETTALMGRQSASTSKYEVSWTYHPDKGLEAMFKIK